MFVISCLDGIDHDLRIGSLAVDLYCATGEVVGLQETTTSSTGSRTVILRQPPSTSVKRDAGFHALEFLDRSTPDKLANTQSTMSILMQIQRRLWIVR